MAYFGELSVNRYKIGRTKFTSPKVKKWMAVLASVIRGFSEDLELPITIKLAGNFKDERYPDLSNLHKVIGDAVEMGLGINDKYYKFVDGDVTLGALTPTVEIEILGTKVVDPDVEVQNLREYPASSSQFRRPNVEGG